MDNKTFGWVKVLYIIMAVLYIIAGISFFTNPITSEYVLGTFIGSLMMVYGVMMIIAYFTAVNFKSVWALVLGFVLIVLGLVVVTNQFHAMNILGILAGIGFLCSGAYKVFNSFQLKDLGLKGWIWILILGILTIIVGCILLSNPTFAGGYLTIWVGAYFLVNGISDLVLGFIAF